LRIIRVLLRFLTSTKVGIVVMAVLAVLSLIGASVPQGAPHEAYVAAYGKFWGNLVWYPGFTDIFRADYFTALLILLCLMVFLCSLRRLPHKVSVARRKEFVFDRGRIDDMPCRADLVLDVEGEEAALHVKDICKRRFYSVSSTSRGGVDALFASKMAFSRYGSFILHLSFIFLLVGGITTTRLGFRYYREVVVGDEFTLPVSGGEEVTVMVEDFNVEFDENDNISDFICDVALARDLDIVLRYSIRPNHPLKYRGREIYLQSYEEVMDGFVVTVYDSLGRVLIPHLFLSIEEPIYVEQLEATARIDLGLVPTVRLLPDAGGVETYIVQESLDRHAYRFVVMYVVPSVAVSLEIVKEPFQGFIIAGLALLTLGTFISLYLSHRRFWFMVTPLPDRKARVVFGGSANRNRIGFEQEFEAIRETLDELA
jgi:cytochrome c biogenesis protein